MEGPGGSKEAGCIRPRRTHPPPSPPPSRLHSSSAAASSSKLLHTMEKNKPPAPLLPLALPRPISFENICFSRARPYRVRLYGWMLTDDYRYTDARGAQEGSEGGGKGLETQKQPPFAPHFETPLAIPNAHSLHYTKVGAKANRGRPVSPSPTRCPPAPCPHECTSIERDPPPPTRKDTGRGGDSLALAPPKKKARAASFPQILHIQSLLPPLPIHKEGPRRKKTEGKKRDRLRTPPPLPSPPSPQPNPPPPVSPLIGR